MIIQTDADGTIYQGNLLVSLGWRYIRFLFKEKKYFLFADRLVRLPFFYFFSHLPFFIQTAFVPFKDCPVELINETRKPLKKKWLKTVKELNPDRIIIISRQDKNILEAFIDNCPELKKYNPEIISNVAGINGGKFTGKFEILVNPYQKQEHINEDLFYLGDLRDYFLWGRRKNKFILV
ncbi:MAG: hypothetical protein ABIG40_03330 [Parcubacteria group bacterium]